MPSESVVKVAETVRSLLAASAQTASLRCHGTQTATHVAAPLSITGNAPSPRHKAHRRAPAAPALAGGVAVRRSCLPALDLPSRSGRTGRAGLGQRARGGEGSRVWSGPCRCDAGVGIWREMPSDAGWGWSGRVCVWREGWVWGCELTERPDWVRARPPQDRLDRSE